LIACIRNEKVVQHPKPEFFIGEQDSARGYIELKTDGISFRRSKFYPAQTGLFTVPSDGMPSSDGYRTPAGGGPPHVFISLAGQSYEGRSQSSMNSGRSEERLSFAEGQRLLPTG